MRTDVWVAEGNEVPPWTTTSVKIRPTEHPRLVVGTNKFPEVVVHTQLLPGKQGTIFLTNPHAYPVPLSVQTPIATALPIPWIDDDWQEPQDKWVAWTHTITDERPMLTVQVEGKDITGLLDTGADASVIAGPHWEQTWERSPITRPVVGVGGGAQAFRSARLLRWECEGKTGLFRPLCIPELPYSLWGRDLLGQMEVSLTSPLNS